MRISRGRKAMITAALAAAVGGALVGIVGASSDNPRDRYVVFSEEAGTDISVRQLLIRGDLHEVRSAVREYDGWILGSFGQQHDVVFPIERLTDLERLRRRLEARSFETEYVPVGHLFSELERNGHP